jgi:DNA-binding MarR family transcriptional regulator
MPATSSDLVQLAWANLVSTGSTAFQRVEEDLKRLGHPPLSWYDVLWELERAPEGALQQSEVQARILIAQYNFTRLLDRLEKADLIRRVPCKIDGRSNVLHITDTGRALRRGMWPDYDAAIFEHVGRHLQEGEAETLAGLLGKLLPDRGKLPLKTRQSSRGAGT